MKCKGKPKQVLMVKNYDILDIFDHQDEQDMLKDMGFIVKRFDTVDTAKSVRYNPLKYVKKDTDIFFFADFLVNNTVRPDSIDSSSSPLFCEKLPYEYERNLLMSLMALLRDWFPPEDYSLDGLLTLLSMAEAKENDENFKSPLDMIFDEIETGKTYTLNPDYGKDGHKNFEDKYILADSKMVGKDEIYPAEVGGLDPSQDFALGHYKEFRRLPIRIRNKIVESCAARLGVFGIDTVKDFIKVDEMALDNESVQNTDIGYAIVCRDLKHGTPLTLLQEALYMQARSFASENGFIFSEVKHGCE